MPLFACFPVLMFFAALGLLGILIVMFGAYNRTDEPEPAEPKAKRELTWPWVVAIVITIIVPLMMLLGVWLLPEW